MTAAVEIPVPSSWRQVAPPASEYAIGDVTVRVSVVQGLPEDPPDWMKVEVARLAAGAATTGPTLAPITTETGWPAIVGSATVGGDKLALVMYQFLEKAAVATVRGPADAFDAQQSAIMDVLMRAQIRWGAPPVTLADLLDGSVRSTSG